jgi:GT2 family glycosyltransferase
MLRLDERTDPGPGRESQPRVFVVVASHDRCEHTLSCMRQLSVQTYASVTVVLVDDGSTDGTAEAVRADFPDVEVFEGDGDLWWTGATNLGVERALDVADAGDYVLTLNDDTEFAPDYVEKLLGTGLRHHDALVGTTVVDRVDRQTVIDGGVRMRWATAGQSDAAGGRPLAVLQADHDLVVPVDVLAGRGALIPVSVFRQVGTYAGDELPHYAADYEFSRRANRAGHPLLMDHGVVVYTGNRAREPRPGAPALTRSRLQHVLVSRRSPRSLRYQFRYARLVCPWYLVPTYMIGLVVRMAVASIGRRTGRDS